MKGVAKPRKLSLQEGGGDGIRQSLRRADHDLV